jgi:hypothetical protein
MVALTNLNLLILYYCAKNNIKKFDEGEKSLKNETDDVVVLLNKELEKLLEQAVSKPPFNLPVNHYNLSSLHKDIVELSGKDIEGYITMLETQMVDFELNFNLLKDLSKGMSSQEKTILYLGFIVAQYPNVLNILDKVQNNLSEHELTLIKSFFKLN